jgi:hypothetical protein
LPKGLPIHYTPSSFLGFQHLMCDFWFGPYKGFWETPRPKFLRVPPSFFNVLIDLSSHFFQRGRLHFL